MKSLFHSALRIPHSALISAFLLAALTLTLALTAGLGANPATAAAPITQNTSPDTITKPQRVNMYFRDRMEPSTWESLGYDLPETAEDSDVPGYLGYVPNVPMTPDQYALARSKGIFVRVVGDIPSSTPDWDVCYRDYPAMLTYLNSVVSRFPNLASLTDIGDSWCKAHPGQCPAPHAGNGFDVWRIKLTNSAIPGPKPRFHLVAAHHAREIATPERHGLRHQRRLHVASRQPRSIRRPRRKPRRLVPCRHRRSLLAQER